MNVVNVKMRRRKTSLKSISKNEINIRNRLASLDFGEERSDWGDGKKDISQLFVFRAALWNIVCLFTLGICSLSSFDYLLFLPDTFGRF